MPNGVLNGSGERELDRLKVTQAGCDWINDEVKLIEIRNLLVISMCAKRDSAFQTELDD